MQTLPDDSGPTRSAPTPLEQELDERLIRFVRLRWLAALSIVAGTWMARQWIGVEYSPWPLYVVGAAVAAYNCIFALLWRRLDAGDRQRFCRPSIHVQIGLDWVALICLVHYTGGVQSPVALAFVFHLILGALLLSRLASFIQAVSSSALLALLIAAEEMGWWLPLAMPTDALGGLPPMQTSIIRWLILSVFFAVTAVLMTAIGARLREGEGSLVDSERRLDRAYRDMEALYELGQAANATLDVDKVLALIAENGARLMGLRACAIGLLDESGEQIDTAATFGLSQEYLEKGPVQVAHSEMLAQALAGHAVRIHTVTPDSPLQYPDPIAREGLRSILCVALQIKGRPIGVVRVYSEREREFTDADVTFLRNLANLAAVAIESARAYGESEALSEERAWFARTTHHQLRAPLAVVSGVLDALPYAGELSPKQAQLVERSRRRVQELLDLVRDLLDLANARRATHDLEPEPVVLSESLGPALETTGEQAEMKQVQFAIEGSGQDAAVAAQADDVRRIFTNLLENAVKYTPTGGAVTYRAEQRGEMVSVEIRDSGIGIGEEDREKIFQGFYRSEAAKATGEIGTGVGLIIVSTLVERWQGTLELVSSPGEGTTFTVNLPAATSGPAATDAPLAA